ncbi:Haloacid dehalogenase domain protein hydrolase type 3 [Halovivax asiaticus JCM 14624]|uniref:Haloacid dehalogenase domain protein hydrolase type 3 n=1 Tax=Halovivax asiaticus JCM 14624 TaxID=1227490 RepID=M0BC30_9EURY|nr:HAD hydrolase family protein [Halovivax asiaticus]ELZ07219.1 Haloacid dehalogenase domain protein hydrolase type 3 [Halovivax asiaticus JCM 14624]
MVTHDTLYELYESYDTDSVRAYQTFVDLLPPMDSRVVLEYWDRANAELDRRKERIRSAFDEGETLAGVAATATRDQAFTALDLSTSHGRPVNVLVLDVDETLRSAGGTDNEIPRETLHALTRFHEAGVPIVICTGQTLENVKGFAIQGLGSELVHSGDLAIVYESGTGVFAPGHGAETKQLLYEALDEPIRAIFEDVRGRVLTDAPADLRRGCHLQGNEFNVTLKPNYEIGSSDARELIDEALGYLLDLLADAVYRQLSATGSDVVDERGAPDLRQQTRAFYADADPEIRRVLERAGTYPGTDAGELSDAHVDVLERIDVAYYEADAAEIGSLELNKVVGVQRALDVLGVADPFALVMGDSKSDLRVMEWVAENSAGIAAAPNHASKAVLDHVLSTEELVFDRGKSADVLQTIAAMNEFAQVPE